MSKQRVIKLERLLSNGVVHEEYQEFENSIFSLLYSRAARQIEKIVSNNKLWVENGKSQKNTDFERSNVISFVGKRGTGKTSAMLSFKDQLEEHTKVNKYSVGNIKLFEEKSMDNVKFYTLDCIDVSVLEESENVFILVLANMFSKIQKRTQGESQKIKEYDNRLIFQKFDKIYEDYISINSTEQSMEGFSAYERLRNAASSQRIRENFAELVKIYLNMLDSGMMNSFRSEQNYLVIALDDIDIARRKKGNGTDNWGTYKIMNVIYKYLTVPGVIVLASYDNISLQERCINFFKDEKDGNPGYEEAAFQYIEKIFPIYSRLYMPPLKRKEFLNEDEVKICVTNEEKNFFDGVNISESVLQIQKFIFRLLYSKTEVCFDCDETNKHFFEPDTLRTLYNIVELLNKLETYDHTFSNEGDIERFVNNIEWMEEDCNFRYKEEILNANKMESNLIDLWMEEPINRRGKSIVSHMCKTILPLGLSIRKEYEQRKNDVLKANQDIADTKNSALYDNSKVAYSYAELVHSIFHMTRNERVYSKKFVACILYSYTLKLTEIYKLYICNKRKLSKYEFLSVFRDSKKSNENVDKNMMGIIRKINNCHQALTSVIGETIIGKWVEYFFPEVKIKVGRTYGIYGMLDNPERGSIISYITNPIEDLKIFFNNSDSEKVITLKLKQIVFITMMYVDVSRFTEEKVSWNLDGSRGILQLSSNTPGDFEFTAFLKHSFSYVKYLNMLERLTLELLESEEEKQKKKKLDIKILKNNLQKAFDKLWDEYYEWDHKYGNACIPFYNLDITYNMIKKHYLKYEQSVPHYLEITMRDKNTPFLKEYKKMLTSFEEYLASIDETYGLEGEKAFAEVFTNCPFYKIIDDLQSDEENRLKISDYMCSKIMQTIGDMSTINQPEG